MTSRSPTMEAVCDDGAPGRNARCVAGGAEAGVGARACGDVAADAEADLGAAATPATVLEGSSAEPGGAGPRSAGRARGPARFAIVLAARDEEAELPACLALLGPFRAAGDAVIVVDDGSRDATAALAAEAGAIVLAAAERGRAAAYREGVARALALDPPVDAVMLLQADVRLGAGAREALLRVASGRADDRGGADDPGDADGAGRLRELLAWFPHRVRSARRVFRVIERANAWRARRLGLVYGDQVPVVGVAALAMVGGFPAVARHEDLALALAVRRARGRWREVGDGVTISARHWEGGVVRAHLRNAAVVAGQVARELIGRA